MKKIALNAFLVLVLLFSLFKTDATVSAAGEGACVADKTGLTEFDGLSNLDLLARLIYSEARGETTQGLYGVARVVHNRVLKNLTEFGGSSVKGVILKTPGGFVGMTTVDARCPYTDGVQGAEWRAALQAANIYGTEPNPVGKTLWFNTNSVYSSRVIKDSQGKDTYKFPNISYYQTVVEKYIVGGHTFFRVSGY